VDSETLSVSFSYHLILKSLVHLRHGMFFFLPVHDVTKSFGKRCWVRQNRLWFHALTSQPVSKGKSSQTEWLSCSWRLNALLPEFSFSPESSGFISSSRLCLLESDRWTSFVRSRCLSDAEVRTAVVCLVIVLSEGQPTNKGLVRLRTPASPQGGPRPGECHRSACVRFPSCHTEYWRRHVF